MIIFHKYEIRLMPGKTALELYAPNWEKAEQSKNYQDLLSVHHPRRLQVVDSQHRYHNQGPTRDATPQEVERYIKDGTYLRDDNLEILAPFYTYRYFGDESVLKPLNQKLQAEYDAYLADWKICMGRSRTEFFDRLEEVCTVQTEGNGNLLNPSAVSQLEVRQGIVPSRTAGQQGGTSRTDGAPSCLVCRGARNTNIYSE